MLKFLETSRGINSLNFIVSSIHESMQASIENKVETDKANAEFILLQGYNYR